MNRITDVAAWPLWLAHVGSAGPQNWSSLARAWEWEPLLLFSLLASAWVYRRGVRRLREQVASGHGLRSWEVGCFWVGWWTLVVALVSPLHPWGRVLFSAHMTQHELLMLVAAPLLVLGRPVVALLFALPRSDARQLSRAMRQAKVRALWRGLTHPLSAWLVHALALWVWHAPALYQLTLTNELVHHLQHVSFFASALLFWWSVWHHGRGAATGGAAILYLFTTMVHSGLLGALLTFSNERWYPRYGDKAEAWSLSPLQDQQLGGLIMWVPAGLVYVLAALVMLGRWLHPPERRNGAAAALGGAKADAINLLLFALGLGAVGRTLAHLA